MPILYEQDILLWAAEQARLLRAGRFSELDIDHIAEEIEDVGKSEQRELASRIAVLLAHFRKWVVQPEWRCRSWEMTLQTQRKSILRRMEKTPSLKAVLNDSEWWDDLWGDARLLAGKETGMAMDRFPEVCPWSPEQTIHLAFFPQ